MQSCGKNFFDLTVAELLTLNLVLTFLLANGLNGKQLNILGNFLCNLGQNILTIQAVIGSISGGAVYCVCEDPAYDAAASCSSSNELNTQLRILQAQIDEINRRLQEL